MPLGYTVNDYATLGSILASGDEYEICVVTDIAVPAAGSGGVIFKTTEPAARPDGSAKQIGDMWFITFSKSNTPFPVAGGSYMYVIAAKQWNGSAYVERVARIRFGGALVPLSLYVFFGPSTCDSVSGGWQSRAWPYNSGFAGALPAVTYGADYVHIALDNVTNKACAHEIATNIDLTSFSTLKFDGYSNHDGIYRHVYLYVISREATYWETGYAARVSLGTVRGDKVVDIAGCNGSFDLSLMMLAQGTNVNPYARMYSLELI